MHVRGKTVCTAIFLIVIIIRSFVINNSASVAVCVSDILQDSGGEQGTLFQLRNLLGRRDVHGPDAVKKDFRSDFAVIKFFKSFLCILFVTYLF